MPGPTPPRINLTARQRAVLERLVRRQTSSQRTVRRARIVLEAASGANNEEVARRLGVKRGSAHRWRSRWLEASQALQAAEDEGHDERDLEVLIEAVLDDEPRPGTPATFTPEQIVQIVALACEPPADSGRPASHWTPRELAEEAVKRGIVERISTRSVGRFLQRGRLEAASQSVLAQLGPRGPDEFQRSGDERL